MKSGFATLLLAVLALALAGRVQARSGPPSRRGLPGRQYVRLTDWAKANGFEVRWLKPDETLQLSNRWSRIVVAVDSREAQINGVQVWLLYPVVAQSGTLCLAQLDVEATLRPLLSPPRNQPGAKVRTSASTRGTAAKTPATRSVRTRRSNTRCCWPRKCARNWRGRD